VKILLDTNALIWWMEDSPRLGPKARNLIANPAHLTIATVVSIWEITMKWRVDKHPLAGSHYAQFAAEEGITLMTVTPDHIAALELLPFHHKDPFDHLIVAQAKVESARLMTSDAHMHNYGVECISTN
jgi:PIN domain nuclease of toxin-antitoxin system